MLPLSFHFVLFVLFLFLFFVFVLSCLFKDKPGEGFFVVSGAIELKGSLLDLKG